MRKTGKMKMAQEMTLIKEKEISSRKKIKKNKHSVMELEIQTMVSTLLRNLLSKLRNAMMLQNQLKVNKPTFVHLISNLVNMLGWKKRHTAFVSSLNIFFLFLLVIIVDTDSNAERKSIVKGKIT